MIENTFKSELLKQNGKTAVDDEVSRLHETIEAEQRRVRRLFRWTIAIWTVWILMISIALVVPMVQARTNPPPATSSTMPVTPPPSHHYGGGQAAFATFAGVLIVAGFIGLPLAGVVLLLLLILTRRTANMNQIRASLAAIDAQLRQLGAPGVGGSGGKDVG